MAIAATQETFTLKRINVSVNPLVAKILKGKSSEDFLANHQQVELTTEEMLLLLSHFEKIDKGRSVTILKAKLDRRSLPEDFVKLSQLQDLANACNVDFFAKRVGDAKNRFVQGLGSHPDI